MRKAAVVGAGKIGATVVDLLVGSGAYEVILVDQSPEALAAFAARPGVTTVAMAIDDLSDVVHRAVKKRRQQAGADGLERGEQLPH